jgi:hypothetical protein
MCINYNSKSVSLSNDEDAKNTENIIFGNEKCCTNLYAVPVVSLRNTELQARDPLSVSYRRRFQSQKAEFAANETDALL